jgi:hypothetical protein
MAVIVFDEQLHVDASGAHPPSSPGIRDLEQHVADLKQARRHED